MATPSPTPHATAQLLASSFCSDRSGFDKIACSDWFIPACGMGFAVVWMYFTFGCLNRLAKRGLTPRAAAMRQDPFQTTKPKDGHVYSQNWSWDYVLVFKVYNEGESLISYAKTDDVREYAQGHTFVSVLSKLAQGKLETSSFYSQDRSMVFVKVRADLERLCRQADVEDYPVKLSNDRVKSKMSEGHWDAAKGRYRWSPKAYSAKLLAQAEDEDWCAANYHQDNGQDNSFEYMLIRDSSRESTRRREQDRRIVARVSPIKDELGLCQYNWWEHHYGPYHDRNAFDLGGGLYEVDSKTGCPFRSVDRLKLINGILEGDPKDGGCGLNLDKMLKSKCTLACFPLHNESDRIAMQTLVIVPWKPPWRMSSAIESIKNYNGEKVGLYFAFLVKYTTWLFPAAVVGSLTFAFAAIEESGSEGELGTYRTRGSSLLVIPCAVFIMMWSTAFLEEWKRAQATTAMKWGMRGFEKLEQQRPEFAMNPEIKLTNSPIDGSKFAYFPAQKRRIRSVLTSGVVLVFILLVLCGILAVFLFKAFTDPSQCAGAIVDDDDFDDATGFVNGQEYGKPTMRCVDGIWSNLRIGPYYSSSGNEVVPEIPLGIVIATILTSVNILVWNRIYAVVSVHLNDYENHRTDTEYEDGLIAKTFSFQMVNSYGALMYIAFVKEPVVNKLESLDLYAMCPYSQGSKNMGRSCVSEVGLQLFSIFVVNMIISTMLNIGIPFLQQYKSTCSRSAETEDDAGVEAEHSVERVKSPTENEFELGDYGELMGLFSDYAELAIQFGYATIFTVAFPAAPLMALLNNLCQIRFDFYKITIRSRRVVPRGAEDIGTWEHLFHIMSTVAIVSNCALVVFAGHYLKDYQRWLPFKAVDAPGNKWLLFILLEHTLLLGRIFLALWIDDVPQDVAIQMSRQDLIVSKLIDDAESDDEEAHKDSCFSFANVANRTIADVDGDFSLPPGNWNALRPGKATAAGRAPQHLKSAQRRETGVPESKHDLR